MTKDEMYRDAEPFKQKEGFGYVHCELEDASKCTVFIAGDLHAIEALSYELLCKLSEASGMPMELLLTTMLLHYATDEHKRVDDDTLEIE